ASHAADRAARHRHRRLLCRQPAGAESGGGAGKEEKAQAAAGRDAARLRSQRRARGPEGGACRRPRGARLRGRGLMSVIDRTAKITRALREIDAHAPKFVWPAQPYYEYQGGPPPEGETLGYVEALCGLCLFVAQAGGAGVVRWFLPAHAVRDSHVGKPLGQMLIDEQAASPETITQALERQKLLRARRLGEYLTANQ